MGSLQLPFLGLLIWLLRRDKINYKNNAKPEYFDFDFYNIGFGTIDKLIGTKTLNKTTSRPNTHPGHGTAIPSINYTEHTQGFGQSPYQTNIYWGPKQVDFQSGTEMLAYPLGKDHPRGQMSSKQDNSMGAQVKITNALYDQRAVALHLLNDNLGGPATTYNLAPIPQVVNSAHERDVESQVKKMVENNNWVWYWVKVGFEKLTKNEHKNLKLNHKNKEELEHLPKTYVSSLTMKWGQLTPYTDSVTGATTQLVPHGTTNEHVYTIDKPTNITGTYTSNPGASNVDLKHTIGPTATAKTFNPALHVFLEYPEGTGPNKIFASEISKIDEALINRIEMLELENKLHVLIKQISNSINENELLDKIREKLKLASQYKSIDEDNIKEIRLKFKDDVEFRNELGEFEIKVKDFNEISLATEVFDTYKAEFVNIAKVNLENDTVLQLFTDKIKEVIATMINQTRLNTLFTASQAKSAVIGTLTEEKQALTEEKQDLIKKNEVLTGKKLFSEAFTTSDDEEEPAAKRRKLSQSAQMLLKSLVDDLELGSDELKNSLSKNMKKADKNMISGINQIIAIKGLLEIEPADEKLQELKTAILQILKDDPSLNERYTNYKPDLGSTSGSVANFLV